MIKKTLLLINGSQILMDLTKKILEREGYSVRCAVGIAGAQERLMDFIPDGIILDSDLPDGNGLDYYRQLRREGIGPVLFMSNHKDDELPALKLGANEFLKKPYDHDIMIARIENMLNANTTFLSMPYVSEDGRYKAVPTEETNSTAHIQKFVHPGTSNETTVKKRIPNIRRLCLSVVGCFMLFFIGFSMFTMLNNGLPYFDMPEPNIPLTEFPFQMEENTKPYTGASQYIHFPGIENITVPADSVSVNVFLLNPEDNSCYFTFEIVLTDTGESLYLSGLVEPGWCIEEITLSSGLAKGEYDATIIIRAYSPDDFSAINVVNVEFCVIAI